MSAYPLLPNRPRLPVVNTVLRSIIIRLAGAKLKSEGWRPIIGVNLCNLWMTLVQIWHTLVSLWTSLIILWMTLVMFRLRLGILKSMESAFSAQKQIKRPENKKSVLKTAILSVYLQILFRKIARNGRNREGMWLHPSCENACNLLPDGYTNAQIPLEGRSGRPSARHGTTMGRAAIEGWMRVETRSGVDRNGFFDNFGNQTYGLKKS